MRTYLNQFDTTNYPIYVPKFLLQAPWEDTSWGNDACPSFFNAYLQVRVFVDFDNPEHRDNPEGTTKYSAEFCDSEMQRLPTAASFDTDNEADLLKWIEAETTARATERVVELRPNSDDKVLQKLYRATLCYQNTCPEDCVSNLRDAIAELQSQYPYIK